MEDNRERGGSDVGRRSKEAMADDPGRRWQTMQEGDGRRYREAMADDPERNLVADNVETREADGKHTEDSFLTPR